MRIKDLLPGIIMNFLASLTVSLLMAAGAAADPSMPQDVFTFEMIAEKLRAPISEKFSEMRMTFRVVEKPVGKDAAKIEFQNEASQAVMTIYFARSMNSAQTERTEEVLVMDTRGRVLFKETILTNGSGLTYSNPTQRIFFETSTAQYGLKPNETEKIVVHTMDGVETLRLVSRQIASRSNASFLMSEIYYGGSRILTISDSVSKDGEIRTLKYGVVGTGFSFSGPGSKMSSRGWPTYEMRVDSARPSGYLIDNHRFYFDDRETFGLNNFIEQFGREIFGPFIVQFANGFYNSVIKANFPVTQRRANLATPNLFLDELVLMRSQLTAPSPAIISLIVTQITGYIDAFQQGTLVITDTRANK
ncbi:MAG: hypothetical protein A2070_10515 [Bdellovibrionales bacterium GWC1_52_8]|nr:MAG: hypothetical protein A2Z97_07785 [Bdellovibrionales bacterium GWB1_52_6]OFZ04778.1 MAG: hypothetical protein A2X97_13725 [Bdellovibrionales bacterium GWA1_52_35]OFZ40346.1 MAG: hypothetical protein A2070_10515 [Bdellovibrionales bacterium GWC1_52_8]HCM39594.1 hypothetical protein [Bdellovibrionales bacterium]